jgi:hypothetical protein
MVTIKSTPPYELRRYQKLKDSSFLRLTLLVLISPVLAILLGIVLIADCISGFINRWRD